MFDDYETAKGRFDRIVDSDKVSFKDAWRVFNARFCKFRDIQRIKGYRIGEYYELDSSGYARYVRDRTETEEIYYQRYSEVRELLFEKIIWKLEDVEKLLRKKRGVDGDFDSPELFDEMMTFGITKAYNKYLSDMGGIESEERLVVDALTGLADLRGELGIDSELSRVSYLERLYVNYRYDLNKQLECRGILVG